MSHVSQFPYTDTIVTVTTNYNSIRDEQTIHSILYDDTMTIAVYKIITMATP